MPDLAPLGLEPLGPGTLDAFEALLGGGGFGGCYCAVWTSHGPQWESRCGDPTRPHRDVTRRRVAAGEHVGYLVREGEGVVGWTGAGPKTGFPLLSTKLASRLSPMTPDVWAIGCLAVPEERRGAGLQRRIVAAVLDLARSAGARAVEAYPTRPWDEPRSYRGSHRVYAGLGFREAGAEPDGDVRVLLMRHELGGTAGTAKAVRAPGGGGSA